MTESLKKGDKVRLTPAGRAALKYEEVGAVPAHFRLKSETVIDLLVPHQALGEVLVVGRIVVGTPKAELVDGLVGVCWPSGLVGLHELADLELVSGQPGDMRRKGWVPPGNADSSLPRDERVDSEDPEGDAKEGSWNIEELTVACPAIRDPTWAAIGNDAGWQGSRHTRQLFDDMIPMDKDVVKSRPLEGDDYARGYERGYNDACRNERAIAALRVARERERQRRKDVSRQVRQERRQMLQDRHQKLDLLQRRMVPGHQDTIASVRAISGERGVRALLRRFHRIYVIAGPRKQLK